ncbi:hypothetical protein [Saccharothrix hoggarensis]|uniref:Uncharacterized protein n=1 Tax=Saccharothrix hoggarensis TaxID=913853 RepID=A0ABW3QNH1_9PSEU
MNDLIQTLRSLTEPEVGDLGDPMPSLLDELRTTMLRQGRMGKVDVGVVSRTADTKLPISDQRGAEAMQALHNELSTWIRDLYGEFMPERTALCLFIAAPDGRGRVLARGFRDGPDCEDSIESMAAWLLRRTSWLAEHPAAAEIYETITAAVARIWWAIDRPPERWFAGVCDLEGCAGEVYGKPDGETAKCRTCGEVFDVHERRVELLRAAQRLRLGAAELSRALPNLLGRPLSEESIRTWARNGELATSWATRGAKAWPVFLVGDVITLALTKPTRRRRRKTDVESVVA